jgi:hypothetical protein
VVVEQIGATAEQRGPERSFVHVHSR